MRHGYTPSWTAALTGLARPAYGAARRLAITGLTIAITPTSAITGAAGRAGIGTGSNHFGFRIDGGCFGVDTYLFGQLSYFVQDSRYGLIIYLAHVSSSVMS